MARSLAASSHIYLKLRHVTATAVGRRGADVVAVFYVDERVPQSKLPKRERIPPWILVNRRKIATDVVEAGRPQFWAAAIGDPASNQKSYRNNGAGNWEMGTRIQIFGGGSSFGSGTSGARVKKKGTSDLRMLSCSHVLSTAGADVAQWEKNRSSATVLNNHAGQVTQVLDLKDGVDAGIAECAGNQREILGIGLPRGPQPPTVGMFVQKSGASTGLTWGKIETTGGTAEARVAGGKPMNGIFAIPNKCTQQPAGAKLEAGVPKNSFGWKGDSGALVVVGKANESEAFGEFDLQGTYNSASDDEKKKIRDKWMHAALGLLIGGDEKNAYAQEIQLGLDGLAIELDL